MKPHHVKVPAIVNMKAPKDKADVTCFMGMVSYLLKWIADMASKAATLRNLT